MSCEWSLIVKLVQRFGTREQMFEGRDSETYPRVELDDVKEMMENDHSLIFGIYCLVERKPCGNVFDNFNTLDNIWVTVTGNQFEDLRETDTHKFYPLDVGLVHQGDSEGRAKIVCGIRRPVGYLGIQIYNDSNRFRRDKWFSAVEEDGRQIKEWLGPFKTKEDAIQSARECVADVLNFVDTEHVSVSTYGGEDGAIPVFLQKESKVKKWKKVFKNTVESMRGKNLRLKLSQWAFSMWRKLIRYKVDQSIKNSCAVSRKRLNRDKPLKILVDNSVIGHNAYLFRNPVYRETLEWPRGKVNELERLSVVPRYRKPDNDVIEENLRFIPSLIYLVIKGFIEFYSSNALIAERLGHPIGRYGGGLGGPFDYHLFSHSDIEIKRFEEDDSWEWQDGLMGHWMDSFDPPPEPRQMTRLKNWLAKKRKNDSVFDELVDCLGKKNIQDIWHIYRANEYGMDFFLTMDAKLIKNVRSQRGNSSIKSLNVKVVLPKELGEEIGVAPLLMDDFRYLYKNTVLRGEKVVNDFGVVGVGRDEFFDRE